MTINSVPTTSCRGCPSSHAGTASLHLATTPVPCALSTAIWCRVDGSGEVPSSAVPSRPPALAHSCVTVTEHPTTRPMTATGACSITVHSSFRLLPVGRPKGNILPTVSAPNRSKRDNCCSARSAPTLPQKPTPGTELNFPGHADAPDVSPDPGPRNLHPKPGPPWTTAIRTRRKESERLASRNPVSLQLAATCVSAAIGP